MADLDRILIVGGGIAGLSLGVAFNRRDSSPERIERDSKWQSDGTAIMTPANGLRVLQELGVDNVLTEHAATIRRWGFYDKRGEQLCETNLESLWKGVGPCLGISRKRLLESLLRAPKAVPHRFGVSITGLKQNCNLVLVKFTHGNSDDYDPAIGADGIYSTVRRLVMNSSQPRYAGNIGWRSIVSIRLPEVVDNIKFFLGEGCIFGLIPIGDECTYGFAGIRESRVEVRKEIRLDYIRRRFAKFGGPVESYLGALQTDEQIHVGPIKQVDLGEWFRGRVAHVGDASNAGPPNMAEGGCMALEDSSVLAEVLRSEDSVSLALEAYVRRRMPRARWVQEQSSAAGMAWFLPPSKRNAVLGEMVDQLFRDLYQPLLSTP